MTRQVIAAAQMLMGALLIHLSGGRIETHFHVFGSLAFLAFYRDLRVLATATVVVVLDHLIRGLVSPGSVYGTVSAGTWRFVEHAFWVVFENIFLAISCFHGRAQLSAMASQQAELEATNERSKPQYGFERANCPSGLRNWRPLAMRQWNLRAQKPVWPT